ncbi:carbonic anhydrase [Rhodoferax antarcticus]|uniref:Carbonic anhydrase 2 n=1 Tax=Rhodoferax antarcticus ANT.BR TaxID=1111071 RepID=A0A1Q8YEU0_9BURK|nr:carbonic anhydrase [Rhodoferax antarcticus]APW46228.1 carbonic anhydrase [Rhodoferax antarcticus]MCW2313492.1 carbonic anhydrase [Rhodoferax antarcticus]OLP06429.1 carbonic anhydrase 2 [Rhodoferax antarcticus ANT.BR]
MDIQNIFIRNKNWVADKTKQDPDFFKNLSSDQAPKILYIGCSDSRVAAEELMGVGPGDIFVHRNIANMVSALDLSCMSVINYAVNHLKVNRVIVCGHYNCGGVRAAMIPEDLGLLNPWLRNIRDVYRLHKNELDSIDSEQKKYERLIELNVQEQCINVIKTADVQRAYLSRGLTVHGWIFNIHTGYLVDLNIDFKAILNGIREIYHLENPL